MVGERQMRWRFSNDLLGFRASCFSLQDLLLLLLFVCLAYVEIHAKEKFLKENTYVKIAFYIEKAFW